MSDDIRKRIENVRRIGREGLHTVCPICQVEVTGIERLAHMRQHVTPETKRLIERVTSLPADEFYSYCLQQGFDIDSLWPKHPTVVSALSSWIRDSKEVTKG